MLVVSTVISTMLYSVLAFYFIQRYISLRSSSIIFRACFDMALSLCSVFASMFLTISRSVHGYNIEPGIIYIANYLLFLLVLILFFQSKPVIEKLFYCGNIMILICAIKGILYPMLSIVTRLPLASLLNRYDSYNVVVIWANMFFFVLISVTTSMVSETDVHELVQSKSRLRSVFVVQSAFMATIMAISITYNINAESQVMPFLQAFSAAALGIGYFIFYRENIKEMKIEDYKFRNNNLKEQLDMQLSHYNAQAGYIDRFRRLKHDYKSQIRGLQFLLQSNKVDDAKKYLSDMQSELDTAVGDYKAYSNNNLVDAIMRDASINCKELGADFQAMAGFPAGTKFGLSDLDLCTLFSNIMRNALESIEKVPEPSKRYITVTTRDTNAWHIISIRNTFAVAPVVKNGSFVTSKKDVQLHGLGVQRIKKIVESVNGMVTVKIDDKEKVFNMILQFPKNAI